MFAGDPLAADAARGGGAGAGRLGADGGARARGRRARRRSGSPIMPPARCSTASRSAPSRRRCSRPRASRWWSRATATSAAARPGPTTCCSRRSPSELRARKVATLEERAPQVIAAGNIGCMMQIGSATASAGGAYRRASRLGDGRAAAAGARALRSGRRERRRGAPRPRRRPGAGRRRRGRGAGAADAGGGGGGRLPRRRPAQRRRDPLLHRHADLRDGDRHGGALPLPPALARAGAARGVPLRRRARHRRDRGGAAGGRGR